MPLILLSGMGADERLFAAQREAFPQLVMPAWIAPQRRDTIASYAARLGESLNLRAPCFVGGASFGGFVAMELARHVDARACFLIGSVRSPAELPRRVRVLRRLQIMTRCVPFELVRRLAGSSVELFGFSSAPRTRQLLRQLSDADATFLRWATRAVLTWQPNPNPLPIPIHQVHGDRDRVLPAACTHPDQLVHGGGHVLTLTHAEEVNRFLRTCIALYDR